MNERWNNLNTRRKGCKMSTLLLVLFVFNAVSLFYHAHQTWGMSGAVAFMNLLAAFVLWVTMQ